MYQSIKSLIQKLLKVFQIEGIYYREGYIIVGKARAVTIWKLLVNFTKPVSVRIDVPIDVS